MTPTPKHIEEASRFAGHICLDTERDVVVQKLSTLLAAQEELAAILERLTVDKGHCPICDALKVEQHKCYVCNLESECAKLRESSTKNYSACEELQNMHDSVLEERDKLCAERDDARKSHKAQSENYARLHNAVVGEGTIVGWPDPIEIAARLRIHNAALLAVARTAMFYWHEGECYCLSQSEGGRTEPCYHCKMGIILKEKLGWDGRNPALEPLGIKVSP